MRDILIVLLAILFTIMTIVLFEIKSISQQFLTLIIVLLVFIIFYMVIDKAHVFKEVDEEININNVDFSEDEDLIELEDDDNQNLVETSIEIETETEQTCGVANNIKDPRYVLEEINTTNFGTVKRKIKNTLE